MVMEICHKSQWQPFKSRFVIFLDIYVTVPCEPNVLHDIILLLFFIFFPNLFSTAKHYRYHAIYVTKRLRESPEGFQWSFFNDHLCWCCMRTEQYYQRAFIIHSTIIDITTDGKVN